MVFSDDPLDVALKWQSMGAPRLHIVDLDGAASGEIHNLDIIKVIAKAVLIPVQLGGGIRDAATLCTIYRGSPARNACCPLAVAAVLVLKEGKATS